jgi:hypothetical protein
MRGFECRVHVRRNSSTFAGGMKVPEGLLSGSFSDRFQLTNTVVSSPTPSQLSAANLAAAMEKIVSSSVLVRLCSSPSIVDIAMSAPL